MEIPMTIFLSKKKFEELAREIFDAMSIEDTAKLLCNVWTEEGITKLKQAIDKEMYPRRKRSVR